MIHSTFWKKNLISSTFWEKTSLEAHSREKNMIDSTLWKKHDWQDILEKKIIESKFLE
jgi:hypothetical protein